MGFGCKVLGYVLRSGLNNDCGVAPCAVSSGGRHSVYDNLIRPRRTWDNKSTGAHAEAVDSTSVLLGDKPVFRRPKFFCVRRIVVADCVYRCTGMLHTHTHRECFCLKRFRGDRRKHFVDVGSRMSSGKKNSVARELYFFARDYVFGNDSCHSFFWCGCFIGSGGPGGLGGFFVLGQKGDAPEAKMELAAKLQYFFSHVLDNRREPVRSNVRMRIAKDFFVRSKVIENGKHLGDVATLVASGVEFSVAECSGPALAKTVVAVRVDFSLSADCGYVTFSCGGILSTLDYLWLDSMLQQFQCAKQSCRSGADNHDSFFGGDFFPLWFKSLWPGFFSDIDFVAEDYLDFSMPCIDGAFFKNVFRVFRQILDSIFGKGPPNLFFYRGLIFFYIGTDCDCGTVYHKQESTI